MCLSGRCNHHTSFVKCDTLKFTSVAHEFFLRRGINRALTSLIVCPIWKRKTACDGPPVCAAVTQTDTSSGCFLQQKTKTFLFPFQKTPASKKTAARTLGLKPHTKLFLRVAKFRHFSTSLTLAISLQLKYKGKIDDTDTIRREISQLTRDYAYVGSFANGLNFIRRCETVEKVLNTNRR